MFINLRILRNSAFMLVSALFLSCENPSDISIGGLGEDAKAFFDDNLEMTVETFLMDSVITSGQSSALVGTYTDPIFGEITAESYIQPTLVQNVNSFTGSVTVSEFTFPSTQVYDSLVLRLLNNDLVMFGDTNQAMSIEIHRLKKPLENKTFNNDVKIEYESAVLATKTFRRADLANGKDLYLRLPDVIGAELLKLANTDDGKSRAAFESKFPGFAIVSKSNDNLMNVFNLGPLSSNVSDLVLYFHQQNSTTVEGLPFDFSAGRHNFIGSKKDGTPLAQLKQKTDAFKSADTLGYVQSAVGVGTKIKFPGLTKLEGVQVSYAILTFKADTNSFDGKYPRAPFLTFINVDDNNKVKRADGNYVYVSNNQASTSGILSTYNDSTAVFQADITPFMHDILFSRDINKSLGIVAAVPGSSSNTGVVYHGGPNRMILRDFKLNLYYTQKK